MDWKDEFTFTDDGHFVAIGDDDDVAKDGEVVRKRMMMMDGAPDPVRAWFDACRGKPQDATTPHPALKAARDAKAKAYADYAARLDPWRQDDTPTTRADAYARYNDRISNAWRKGTLP